MITDMTRNCSLTNEQEDLAQYWEDLDRHWHLPPLEETQFADTISQEEGKVKRRRRIRRAQHTAAAMVARHMAW